MRHCKAKNAHGAPCGAPESLVDPATGFCPSHGPGASQRMVEIGRKGAEATKRKYAGGGLPSEHLGSLETIRDAQRWLRMIAEAVGERRLTYSEGQSMTAAVREWIKAEDARLRAEDLQELQAEVADLKRQRRRVS